MRGDPKAADQLLPLVYEELRKLAAAKMALRPAGTMIVTPNEREQVRQQMKKSAGPC